MTQAADGTPGYADDLIDELTLATVRSLCLTDGPWASIYLPTHRDRPDLRHDALLLRGLVESAQRQLQDRGMRPDAGGELLQPLQALVEDRPFWSTQADGLALFARPGQAQYFRLPIAVSAMATVGERPHVLPLAPAVSADEDFYVLALSLGRVRLFLARRHAIHEVSLGPIPASAQEMERRRGREPELQHQPEPRLSGTATFHGHGGTETSDIELRNFVLEVASGLRERIGADTRRPVVLAGVAEHLPALRETGLVPTLADEIVPGNADEAAPDDLLRAAWPIVAQGVERRAADLAEQAREWRGTGRAVTDLAELQRAAAEGRIDTVLAASAPRDEDPEDVTAAEGSSSDAAARTQQLDEIVSRALAAGSDLRAISSLPDGARVMALLRY